jgi:hypothetical protein
VRASSNSLACDSASVCLCRHPIFLVGTARDNEAANQLPKSVVREIRTPRSVGAGDGRPPPATRWAVSNDRPYRASY